MGTKKNSHGTGSLFKRGKKGIYYIQYYADGKRKATRLLDPDGKSITDKRKADAAAKSFLAPMQETTKIDQLWAASSCALVGLGRPSNGACWGRPLFIFGGDSVLTVNLRGKDEKG